jgi:hypothetical protein
VASLLFGVLTVWASSAIARLLIGGGITLVVASGIGAAVTGFMDYASNSIAGLPLIPLSLIQLAGFGTAFSVIGGAIITRAALVTASNFMGVKVA